MDRKARFSTKITPTYQELLRHRQAPQPSAAAASMEADEKRDFETEKSYKSEGVSTVICLLPGACSPHESPNREVQRILQVSRWRLRNRVCKAGALHGGRPLDATGTSDA